MKRLCLVLMAVLFLAPGCGLFGKQSEKSAAELIAEGRQYFEEEEFRDALAAFQRIRDWYPFSKHATEATLKIADAHFVLEEYAEAAVSYGEFERLHPKHPETPRAVYRLGMCHFNRIDAIDRDQTPAKNAIAVFQRMQVEYANTPYTEKAGKRIADCRESLAGAEYDVARFYFRTDRYIASRGRIEALLAAYGDTTYAEKGQKLLEDVTRAIEEQEAAAQKKQEAAPRSN